MFLARGELSPQNLQLLLQIEVKLSELLVGLMVHVGLTGLLAAPKARRRVIVVVTRSEVQVRWQNLVLRGVLREILEIPTLKQRAVLRLGGDAG